MLITELGKSIKARRNTLWISQRDLAEMAEISLNTLYKIETGKVNPTVKVINKLAKVLGMELKLEVQKPKL